MKLHYFKNHLISHPANHVVKIAITLMLLINSMAYADKSVTLPELRRPAHIIVGDCHLYIAEKKSVHIYSINDFKRIKTIDRIENDGGKLKRVNNFFLGNNCLYTTHMGGLNQFSLTGEFKNKITASGFFVYFKQAGNKFIGEAIEGDIFTISLYDSSLKKEKELYRLQMPPKEGFSILMPNKSYFSSGGKIYMNGENGIINCLNQKGETLHQIELSSMIKKRNFTDEDKEKRLNEIKRRPGLNMMYEMNRDKVIIPKYYPAIQTFYLADNQLYVLTYEKKEDDHVCLVLEFDGKLRKKIMLPLIFSSLTKWYPFTIKKGKLYQVIKNPVKKEDGWTWELRITNI